MSKKPLYAAIAAVAVALAICAIESAVFAASQNFLPDVVFKAENPVHVHDLQAHIGPGRLAR